jgi:hypothetical protein
MLATTLIVLLPCLVQVEEVASVADELLTIYPDDQVVLQTAHYEVQVKGTPEEAEEFGALLENAWKQYKGFLRGSPRKSKGPVLVKLYETREAWLEGLETEGVILPANTDFVFYSPERKTVFLYRGRDEYWTRKMALYGTFQQFHYRQKAKNQDLAKSWFVHGMADALSTHLWDGEELKLNANHTFEHNNRACAAVGRGVTERIEDGELGLKDLQDPDLRWAMVAYLLRTDGGRERKSFEKLALGSRGSMLLGRDYAQKLGGEKKLAAGLHKWLLASTRVLKATWGDWTETTDALHGTRPDHLLHALAMTDRHAEFLEVRVEPGAESIGGVLLDFSGESTYIVATVDRTLLRIQRFSGKKSKLLGEFLLPWPKDGSYLFRIERADGKVSLNVNGDEPGSFPVLGDRMGLFVVEGAIQYRELRWH